MRKMRGGGRRGIEIGIGGRRESIRIEIGIGTEIEIGIGNGGGRRRGIGGVLVRMDMRAAVQRGKRNQNRIQNREVVVRQSNILHITCNI